MVLNTFCIIWGSNYLMQIYNFNSHKIKIKSFLTKKAWLSPGFQNKYTQKYAWKRFYSMIGVLTVITFFVIKGQPSAFSLSMVSIGISSLLRSITPMDGYTISPGIMPMTS